MKGKLSIAFYGLIVGIGLSNWVLVSMVKSNFLALIVTLVLLALLLGEIGKTLTGRAEGILIDGRNKMSLSRLQMTGWTMVVLSGITVAASFNLAVGAPSPLVFTIPNELLVAMGIAGASAVASPLVLAATKSPQPDTAAAPEAAPAPVPSTTLHTNGDMRDAAWSDLFKGEDVGSAATMDISKVQQFFITLMLLAVYTIAMAKAFTGVAVIQNLPVLDETFLYLMGISHATYIAYKGIQKPATS